MYWDRNKYMFKTATTTTIKKKYSNVLKREVIAPKHLRTDTANIQTAVQCNPMQCISMQDKARQWNYIMGVDTICLAWKNYDEH